MNVNSVNLITTTPNNMHNIEYVHSTPDGDNLVAYMARVSNPKNQNNTTTTITRRLATANQTSTSIE